MGEKMKDSDRRTERRMDLVRPLGFKSGGASAYWAMSLDVSPSGFRIFTNHPIEVGQELDFTSRHLWSEAKKGKVQWVKPMGNNIVKAGFRITA